MVASSYPTLSLVTVGSPFAEVPSPPETLPSILLELLELLELHPVMATDAINKTAKMELKNFFFIKKSPFCL